MDSPIIGYGYHEKIKNLPDNFRVDYVFNNLHAGQKLFNGEKNIKVITYEHFKRMHPRLVIILLSNEDNIKKAIADLEKLGFPYVLYDDCIFKPYKITAKEIIEKHNSHYKDIWENEIIIKHSNTIPNITFYLNEIHAKNKNTVHNKIEIGENIKIVYELNIDIRDGYNYIRIGDNANIVKCKCVLSNRSIINIGNDCLFGHDVTLRASSSHPIFDLSTKKRLNLKDELIVGNHVWLGESVRLMSGAKIGDGCVVGACAITSSQFSQKNCILAGVPAKIIKENILWSKDTKALETLFDFDDCQDKSALKYL